MDAKNWKEMFHSLWKLLLAGGLDVNSLNKNGTTMLSNAAACGNLEIVEFLLQEGADADVANSSGFKPLHMAARCGRKDIVKFFLDRGIPVDSCDNDESTALHHVAVAKCISSVGRETYEELVYTLVDRNANINAVNRRGSTPLLRAAEFSLKHMVELFFKLGADLKYCDKNQWTILHYACESGWTGIVRTLLEKRFEIDLSTRTSEGLTPVIIAARNSHEDIVKILIESGFEVEGKNNFGVTLLHYACSEGWLDLVKFLVNKGCDLNAKDKGGETPLIMAVQYSHSSVVEYLIESGADMECFNAFGETALYVACKKGLLGIVKSLVRKGCKLNAKDEYGQTPVLWAADCSRASSAVQYLIECGADVEYFNVCGTTVLHIACLRGSLEVVKSLTKKVSNINAQNISHNTPLHFAIMNHHLEIIKHLLIAGADCNVKNTDGYSAFSEYIYQSCCLEVIILFIRSGAYFQNDDYAAISNDSLLKDGILQNTQICTMALINKFNSDLRHIYEIPGVSETLPAIEELKIAIRCTAAQNIAESVEFEIQTKGYCNLLNARPLFLRSLCLGSLFKYFSN